MAKKNLTENDVTEGRFDLARVDTSAALYRKWTAGKCGTAQLAVALANMTPAELSLCASATRAPVSKLEELAEVGALQKPLPL